MNEVRYNYGGPENEVYSSAYLIFKSEQHILTCKYGILRSLLPLVKHYFMTMEEDYNQLKITCQRFNVFVTFSG